MTNENPNASEMTDQPISTFPIEEVARYPFPGLAVPDKLAFSPDDRLITYLFSPEGSLVQQLFAFDPETGRAHPLVAPLDGGDTEENVSQEEALRRERQRQLALGVTQYTWARDADRILIPLQGEVYVKDGVDVASDGPQTPLRKLVESRGSPALDPQISPDGKWVAYVQDAELYVVPSAGGEPRQLSHGARGTGKTHGLAEFIAQEEMHRSHGFWWSHDSKWIAFTEVDETHIPVYRIVHQGKDTVGESAQEDHRYPFVGEANAKVRLAVVPIAGGEPVWMDLGDDDIYLARVAWLPDGGLSAQLQNREQTELELVRFDPNTGGRSLLLHETSAVWINLHDMFKPVKHTRREGEAGGSADSGSADSGFIWASEHTGFRHLYLCDAHGNLIRPLTKGEWMVDGIAGVDQERGYVYFTATRDSPLESHLYAVSFAGEEPRRITREPGTHTVVVDHGCQRFVDVHQSLGAPPTVTLRGLADGSALCTIYDRSDPRVDELALPPPELVTLQSRDGATLYGAIYHPPASFGPGPHPTIVNVYGGPHVQLVADRWGMTVAMRRQYLRSLGFLVFVLDNRGSARRGLEFESAIKNDMGHVEVQDQVDGVRWLVERGLADPDRVGIYGWSYGGYMAAMCLARAPETFKVAVAGAPVTHFDGYDTHYTERYMGTPQSNPQGYLESNIMHHVENITGKLMLIHGLIDENVHFRHTARLINALIQARKPYDLLLFPDERHAPRKLADRVFMEERIGDYFMQHL
jgi:dipeptidyl-peptidase-4